LSQNRQIQSMYGSQNKSKNHATELKIYIFTVTNTCALSSFWRLSGYSNTKFEHNAKYVLPQRMVIHVVPFEVKTIHTTTFFNILHSVESISTGGLHCSLPYFWCVKSRRGGWFDISIYSQNSIFIYKYICWFPKLWI